MSKYFKASELECKCGCGLNNFHDGVLNQLDTARMIAGIPFVINRGCSCEKHNKEVGGSETSSHLKGLAVDIKADTSYRRFKILNALISAGFNRIGIGKTFIHADMDAHKDQMVTWLY